MIRRFWIGSAISLALVGPVMAQTTPSGTVSTLRPVITSYPQSPFSVGAGIVTLTLGSSANEIRLPNGAGPEYGGCLWASNVFTCGNTTNGGTTRSFQVFSAGAINFAPNGGANIWQIATTGHILASTDNANDIGATGATRPRSLYLAGPAVTAPTDSTATDSGDLVRLRSQSTITPASAGVGNCGTAFAAAALTADCTIATLPAGMKLTAVYADVTAGFTCSGTCTGTKVVQCGTAAGGTQVLATSLSVAATGQFGLADADLGSGMTRAAAIQGGLIGSWTATTPISCRFTSGTGNWGNASTTFVNAGSIKFTLITEQIK